MECLTSDSHRFRSRRKRRDQVRRIQISSCHHTDHNSMELADDSSSSSQLDGYLVTDMTGSLHAVEVQHSSMGKRKSKLLRSPTAVTLVETSDLGSSTSSCSADDTDLCCSSSHSTSEHVEERASYGAWLLHPDHHSPARSRKNQDDVDSDVSTEEATRLMLQKADTLERQGLISQALEVHYEWLEEQRCVSPSQCCGDQTVAGRIHLQVGLLQWKLNEYATSEYHLDEALESLEYGDFIKNRIDTFNDSDIERCQHVCRALLAKGRVHLSQGSGKCAKRSFRCALSVLRRQLSSKAIKQDTRSKLQCQYAKAMHGMGMVHEANGHLDRAVEYHQSALEIQLPDESHGVVTDPTDAAETLLSFGSLHEKMGDCNLALSCFTEAYEIYTSLSSSNRCVSVDTGVALTSIGWMHFIQGNRSKALTICNEALDLFQPLGAHRNVAAVMIQKAMIYEDRGLNERASKLFKQALRIQRRVLGDDHEDVASTLLALGRILERKGSLEKATGLFHHAVQIRRTVFGSHHLLVGEALEVLGSLYYRTGFQDAAYLCFTDAMTVCHEHGVRDDRFERLHAALRAVTPVSTSSQLINPNLGPPKLVCS